MRNHKGILFLCIEKLQCVVVISLSSVWVPALIFCNPIPLLECLLHTQAKCETAQLLLSMIIFKKVKKLFPKPFGNFLFLEIRFWTHSFNQHRSL